MIKYFKVLLFFSVLGIIYGSAFSQLDSISKNANRNKQHKEKHGDAIFGGISNVYGYRTLKVREGLFAQPLGVRADERALWTSSFELGCRVEMYEKFSLEFGMEFNRMGLQYRTPTDSVFVGYNQVIRGLTSPVRCVFQPLKFGENFLIQFGAGAAPRMFMASKLTEIRLNSLGQEEEFVTIEKNGFNYFNVDVLTNIGFRWNFGESLGLYIIPEFRYGLLDSYDKQHPYIQHNYALYLRWGLHYIL
jgi:hypothetical protein